MFEILDVPPNLDIAFSSLSVAPTEKSLRAFSPSFTTEQTVGNLAALRDHLEQRINVSLHLGLLTDTSLAFRLLSEKGIDVTTLDRPDAYQIWDLSRDMLGNISRLQLSKVAEDGGRFLHNVPTDWWSRKKVKEGITLMKEQGDCDQQEIVLRVHAGHWTLNNGKSGEWIRNMLRGSGVSLAIEIFADNQTQSEYRELVESLAKDNSSNTPVYYDLDTGHLERSRFKQNGRAEGKGALEFVEDIVKTRGDLLAVTSLNRYNDGDVLTHASFFTEGGIEFAGKVGAILGKGVHHRKINPRVFTVIESMPFHLKEWFAPEGIRFVNNLKQSFEQHAH